ncbi:hypothetical protein MIND_01237700 [Mycena indigotica]|uniref:Uncharacterized protein n=1 Tax=Mycena indigotica TaxID=2126181 RepID=A0A8H6S4K5_9AGAR|nr:uncharacterized protein MIND_01237700 [Mycena indigotica]KAF7292110.1 hypothetical protein MIND_01237700 [Mycena indigotica]
MHAAEASENWDDDFEFQSTSSKRTRRPPLNSHDQPPHDHLYSDTPTTHNDTTSANENGHRHHQRQRGSQSTTENWDDDFAEEEHEQEGHQQYSSTDSHSTSNSHSPISSSSSAASPIPPNPSSSRSSFALPPPPPARALSRPHDSDATRHRDQTPRASKIRSRAGSAATAIQTAQQQWGESSDDDMDAELGFGDEEDRTVTARTGRRALSHHLVHASPPPPVPPLPQSATVGRRGPGLHIPTKESLQNMPFPRSPTASVFSAPDNASIAYTHTSAGSTTHLRPTSRSGKREREAAKGLAGLPPSPPIHRERRRLRKKSRPHGQEKTGTVELRDMRRASEDGAGVTEEEVEDWDADLEREREEEERQHQRYNPYGSSTDVGASQTGTSRNASASQVALSTTSGGGGLLSRIGSVKRWGGGGGVLGRRKKSSSVSVASETLGPDPDLDVLADIHSHSHPALLRSGSQSSSRSRHSYSAPSSSASPTGPVVKRSAIRHSHYAGDAPRTPPRPIPNSTPQSSAGSPADRGRPRVPATASKTGGDLGRDGSPAAGEAVRPYTPSPTGQEEPKESSKLVKRRSLGFVQIRKGLRPLNGDEHATPTAKNSGATAAQTPNASPSKYGGLGVGRPPPSDSVEDLNKASSSEGHGMGFIERNVRRISLVGHKRTKSGVSLSGLPAGLPLSPDSGPVPVPPVDVQLQPPSPPQTVRSPSGGSSMMTIAPGVAAGVDGLPLSFSPTFSNPSTTLNSPVPLASSSTPSLTPHTQSQLPQQKSPLTLSPHGHAASLGRSAAAHGHLPVLASGRGVEMGPGAMRRNSLGDLKIPARISQAQQGLRRDLGMVREFARSVEELKDLQSTYQSLVSEVQGLLDAHVLSHPPPKDESSTTRSTSSPTFFRRHRSNTSSSNPTSPQQAYKQLASAFYTINSKYRISWECAELLIDLGGGGSSSGQPTTSTSAPAMPTVTAAGKTRERAITLTDDSPVPPPMTGPPIASPPNSAWRASTGRNDLSQRQLHLLKEMLAGNADESFISEGGIPEESPTMSLPVNRDWRWGDAMGSTVTLPSEESAGVGVEEKEAKKKRRSSRLRMSGIRDMLRALKRGASANGPLPAKPTAASSTSVSTDSSGHLYEHGHVPTQGRRRAKTSAGPESVRSTNAPRPMSPNDLTASYKTASPSPRRPSLAAIFRIGGKSPKASPPPVSGPEYGFELYPTFSGISGGRESAHNSTEEEDWDRMEDSASASASDAEGMNIGMGMSTGTVRGRGGKSPYGLPILNRPTTPSSPSHPNPMRSPSASGSRTSLAHASGTTRSTRLSNVAEMPGATPSASSSKNGSPSSRSKRTGAGGSVRSMPPVPAVPDLALGRLAMTPENIKPLLENAREVHARLGECVAEIRALLAGGLDGEG